MNVCFMGIRDRFQGAMGSVPFIDARVGGIKEETGWKRGSNTPIMDS